MPAPSSAPAAAEPAAPGGRTGWPKLGPPKVWLAAVITGAVSGLGGAAMVRLLDAVQEWAWGGPPGPLLDAVQADPALRRVSVLLLAGALTAAGHLLFRHLTGGSGIEITTALWFHAGRMPVLRSLGSGVLSVVVVGLGVSLGREGAPKQVGAVTANLLCDRGGMSDEQRRLLVACGAGAGLSAAYGVPLGGTLYALEVLRGSLGLRHVLPVLLTCAVAAGVAWTILPFAPTYSVPPFAAGLGSLLGSLVLGVAAALAAVVFIRVVSWADRHTPVGWRRVVAPLVAMALLGAVAIRFPQVLGNGKDLVQLALGNHIPLALLVALLFLKPAATTLCIGAGAPGGLFTPSLSLGALLGALVGQTWGALWPGVEPGLFALLGAAAVLAATTQGPISALVLIQELTGYGRSFLLPLLVAVSSATLVARLLEPRSLYEARLSEEQLEARRRLRAATP